MFPADDAQQAFDALLFDMDGTILTSIVAAERVWTRWARRHGLDPAILLPRIHGKRAVDTIRDAAVPGLDPEAEAAAILEAEIEDVDGIEAIPGAHALLSELPSDRWAIVTSAPRRLAERRIEAAGLPRPEVLVSGDDVTHGKPAPDAFIEGARRLGVQATDCLIFEDVDAGIRAAESAGAAVVVVSATHASAPSGRYRTITDYRGVRTEAAAAGRLRLQWPD